MTHNGPFIFDIFTNVNKCVKLADKYIMKQIVINEYPKFGEQSEKFYKLF